MSAAEREVGVHKLTREQETAIYKVYVVVPVLLAVVSLFLLLAGQ